MPEAPKPVTQLWPCRIFFSYFNSLHSSYLVSKSLIMTQPKFHHSKSSSSFWETNASHGSDKMSSYNRNRSMYCQRSMSLCLNSSSLKYLELLLLALYFLFRLLACLCVCFLLFLKLLLMQLLLLLLVHDSFPTLLLLLLHCPSHFPRRYCIGRLLLFWCGRRRRLADADFCAAGGCLTCHRRCVCHHWGGCFGSQAAAGHIRIKAAFSQLASSTRF